MSLKEYKRKRDFKRTPEPVGAVRGSAGPLQFVVQKHAATRLHYDFRLELAGTLKSWAVPKGPSLDPSVKALAVHVEDHPLDYADFEGVIPQGQYGGGTVMVWDRGSWEPEDENPTAAFKKGRLKFTLRGEKLKGSWALVRMGGRAGEDGKNWLLIKHDDRFARPAAEYDIAAKKPKSVVTKRTLEQIAKDADRVWGSTGSGGAAGTSDSNGRAPAAAKKATRSSPQPRQRRSGGRAKAATKPSRRTAASGQKSSAKKKAKPVAMPTPDEAASLPGARRAAQPQTLKPQLATLAAEAPRGAQWLHELKFDGYRLLAHIDEGSVKLITRRGNDWTARFRSLARTLSQLPIQRAILDGEVVSLNSQGLSDFQQLQNQLKRGDLDSLAYYVFDLPHYGGVDLTAAPLVERKRLLERLMQAAAPLVGPGVCYSEHLAGEGREVFPQACRAGLEGIVSKRADGRYQQSRSLDWLKTKCTKRQEFVIGGFTEPRGARVAFGALLVGYYDAGRLVYAGKVGTGFTWQSLLDVYRELRQRALPTPPFAAPPRGADARGVTWVRPELVCEIEFAQWTADGQLRHPSFQGLRDDKPPELITREEANVSPMRNPRASEAAGRNGHAGDGKSSRRKTTARPGPKPPGAALEEAVVAGVRISNPQRVVYPGFGVTKLDLAKYYADVADWIMPYIERRPLTLVRCPQGEGSQCFYQKHLTGTMPASVHGVKIKEKDSTDVYVVVHDIEGLAALVQIGVLEFHPWPAREDKLERPDMLVFDLDPGEGLDWRAVVEGARDVRDCLAAFGLESFLRTSGGKGLHICAPLARRNTWEELKEFARGVGETMVRAAPDRYVINMSKAKRRGKIFVDYLRNQRGATAVASYSTRARPGAAVATPLAWDELSTRMKADMFTVANIRDRLKRGFKDPWKGFFSVRQSITRAMMRSIAG